MASKIGLIIGNEYRTRVMKKSFILITVLTPVLFALIIAVPIILAQADSDTKKEIVVIDHSNLYKSVFQNNDKFTFTFTDDLQQARSENTEVAGFLLITGDLTQAESTATLYSEKQSNTETIYFLRDLLSEKVEQQRIDAYNIPDLKEIIRSTNQKVEIKSVKWDKEGKERFSSAEFAMIIGMIAAMLIYMFITIYGAQVMSGVVQEKTNRIMEVMISSVKPFELMMGKIVGIALVGLTQFMIWVVLLLIAYSALMPLLASNTEELVQQTVGASVEMVDSSAASIQNEILQVIEGFDFMKLFLLFIVYFLGGYLLYASFFAAIGSAVDNETDTNQFTIPILVPIFFAFYAAIYSAENPDGPLAFWCSMIPFTSPVVMLVRLPFDVAWWEILLSILILVLSFIGSIWLAGKIYRTGILMYGKKPSYKELYKWLRY